MAVSVDVVLLRETDKAVLVMVKESREEIWLPRSQIIDSESDTLEPGQAGELCITDWIAKEKGLD